jgi:hexosaminidase
MTYSNHALTLGGVVIAAALVLAGCRSAAPGRAASASAVQSAPAAPGDAESNGGEDAPADRGAAAPLAHPPAEQMAVRWGVETNFVDGGGRFRSSLALINESETALPDSGWALYFNFLRNIDPATVPPAVEVTRIDGSFYRLEPTGAFEGIAPGSRFEMTFEAGGSAIKRIDAPAGFYFVFDGPNGEPEAPAPVEDVRVAPFERAEQVNRGPNDELPLPTPATRYRDNRSVGRLPSGRIGSVVPTPAETTDRTGTVTLTTDTPVHYEEGLGQEAALLAEALEPLLGARPDIYAGTDADEAPAVVLRTDPEAGPAPADTTGEAYRLSVAPDAGIEIVGSAPAGVFYGIQSLKGLMPPSVHEDAPSPVTIGAVEIADAPRFPYRGLHLDVSRNFQTAEDVKRLIDLMAEYKLNAFHFHLTDDEGWRLAIPGLPELTEVGARRGHTLDERDHLVPSYGSGPDPDPAASPGSGWYTREAFVDILRYADRRHVRVIPEVDVPGHARAAIKAMEARHRRLAEAGRTEAAERYRLVHPQDTSSYESVQGWDDNTMDVCRPSTYRFMGKVVDEVAAMYADADAPLRTFHVGGDEVPEGVWAGSPPCQQLLAESDSLSEPHDLFTYFLQRMQGMIADRGLTTSGWEEVALQEEEQDGSVVDVPYPGFADREVRAYVWANVWGSGSEDNAYRLANAGYDVVMSHASNLYFDMAHSKHPEEGGFYWASFVDNRGPFAFIPFDLYKSAETDRMGRSIDPDEAYADEERLTAAGRQNVIGIQGQLWGETLTSADRMEYMAAPRLLGLAERAWAPRPAWATAESDAAQDRGLAGDWNAFANRLGRRALVHLSHRHPNWDFRIPVPGAVVEGDTLRANVSLPGFPIHYTTDGGTPTTSDPAYTGPVSVGDAATVKLRAFDATGRGGRTAVVER